MDLNSLDFIFLFLPPFLLLFIAGVSPFRKLLLFVASVLFYFLFQGQNFPFILGLIFVNYGMVWFIATCEQQSRARKNAFWVAIVLNVLILLVFKFLATPSYVEAEFFTNNINSAELKNFVFPVGLSFITFQILSFLIDTYRSKERKAVNIWDYITYLIFFPKIVVGPIARFSQFTPQLHVFNFSWTRIAEGAKRFIKGLAKKAIIADQLATLVNAGFGLDKPAYPTSIAWLVVIAFFIQIYYDFSGYVDMALGLAQIVGIDLPENFNLPYQSKSLSEFWRRWHMTLTAWFRDYVFYPLEYKRRKTKFLRVESDTLVVFLLTGLWHGLTPNYVIWGLLQGTVIVFENSRFGAWIKKLPAFLQHIYLISVVLVSWVIFRSPSMDFALKLFYRLVVFERDVALYPYSVSQPIPIINNSILIVMVIGLLGLLPLVHIFNFSWIVKIKQTTFAPLISGAGYILLLALSIASHVSQSYIPSIYGKF